MKTIACISACLFLVLCAIVPFGGASDIDFYTVKADNGTNFVISFEATEDYASEEIDCNFTFPGDNTFNQITFTYSAYIPNASIPFDLVSDIDPVRTTSFCSSPLIDTPVHTYVLGLLFIWSAQNGANLLSGKVRVYNVGEARNTTRFVAYLLPQKQQRNGPFNFGLTCNGAGVTLYNTTLEADPENNSAASSYRSFVVSLLSCLFF